MGEEVSSRGGECGQGERIRFQRRSMFGREWEGKKKEKEVEDVDLVISGNQTE